MVDSFHVINKSVPLTVQVNWIMEPPKSSKAHYIKHKEANWNLDSALVLLKQATCGDALGTLGSSSGSQDGEINCLSPTCLLCC